MRMVAIETSGRHGSLAALEAVTDNAALVGQVELTGEERTAQVLAPKLRELLAELSWLPQSIDLVAVANGPGSFTGLRLGVTTAKVFAYGVGAEIVAVNTLAVVAAQVSRSMIPLSTGPVWAVIDAQRKELFAAKFRLGNDGRYQPDMQTRIVSQDAWVADLQPGDCVTGPALGRLAGRVPSGVIVVPETTWQPTAATVGRLAWQAYREGQRDDVWKLTPNYFRLSAAEEKAAARGAPNSMQATKGQ